VLEIRSVDGDGVIAAGYYNPRPSMSREPGPSGMPRQPGSSWSCGTPTTLAAPTT
jgi:hypothetical protein